MHGGKGVLFVLCLRVPFRVSVADDRRMIGLTSYSRIDFSFIYVLIIDARTDGIRTIKFIINPVDFSAENQLIEDVSDSTPQMSNTSIPTTPKKTSFSYSNLNVLIPSHLPHSTSSHQSSDITCLYYISVFVIGTLLSLWV